MVHRGCERWGGGQVEGGDKLAGQGTAPIKDCWWKLLEFSPHPSMSVTPQIELKAEATNPVTR